MHLFAIILLATEKKAMHWLIHLGGPGLILLGIADNSLIPLPGSTDIVTILLAAHRREPWLYYTIMATAGAILGGYFTYRMARKGGKETLEKRFSPRKAKKVYAIFERWGFAAVAIPAILPPPFPITPMLLAAGALQYPTKKFLSALAVGRGIRYTILAYLGYHYGRNIVKFFSQYYWPLMIILIVCTAAASLYGLYQYKRRQKAHRPKILRPQPQIRRRVA